MGAAKGDKRETLGTGEPPLDTCKQPLSLGEHTRFLPGHVAVSRSWTFLGFHKQLRGYKNPDIQRGKDCFSKKGHLS